MEKIRIQKYLSDCGVLSRRKAEDEIAKGNVTVGREKAQIGQKIDSEKDIVSFMGKIVRPSEEKLYLKLNKPRGYVSTLSDERGRKCIADLIGDVPVRVYPIGRLDLDSEGLLLLTNDGEVANKVMHPKNEIEKLYIVKVRSVPTDEQMLSLNRSMTIDGYTIKPCRVTFAQGLPQNKLYFILKEGRNRQIRKMCEQVGLEVTRLQRVSEGIIKLGGLRSGKWEELDRKEIDFLRSL